MKRKIALVPALLAALALPACGKDAGPSPSPETPSCTGTLTWNAGSMAPPYSYEWSVTINDDGTGSFTYGPTFTEDPTYEENNIPLKPDKVTAFCDTVNNAAPDDGTFGGPNMSWTLDGVEGHTNDTDATVEATKDLVGKDRFDKGHATYEKAAAGYVQP